MNGRSSRLRLLVRHFVRRFFENDLIAPAGDSHVGLSHVLAAFVTPGLLVVALVLFKYALVSTTWSHVMELSADDALLYVALSMIVLGISATITWDAFFLDVRDHFVLGVLPVSHRLMALAKLGALAAYLTLLAGAANLIPILLVPLLMLQRAYDATFLGNFLPLTAAHAAATLLSGAWTVLAIVALRGALAACLPAAWFKRLAPLVQGALILLFLAWFVSLPQFLAARPGVMESGGWWVNASPPMWFLGLYQAIIGQSQPVFHHLAAVACWATVVVAGGAVALVFALPAGHHAELAMGVAESARQRPGARLARRLAAFLFSSPRARASFVFTCAGLGRSAAHRIYLAAAVGAGTAWAFSGVFWLFNASGLDALHAPDATTLAVQPILVLFLVVAIRYGITVPAALPAHWVFRLTEGATVRDDHAGVRGVARVVGVSVVAALAPLHAALWPWDVTVYHAVLGLLYVHAVVALFFSTQDKYPLAAPYISGSIKLRSRWLLYLFGLWTLTALPALLELQVLRYGRYALLLPLAFLGLASLLGDWRQRREGELPGHVFIEDPGDIPQSLGLSS